MSHEPVEMPFDTALLEGRVTLADGAWATELWRRGLPRDGAVERWNLERPDEVREVARSYAAAGSRIVLTNTFGGNRLRLALHGEAERIAEIDEAGVRLSREGAGERAWVFGSIGPSGRALLDREVSDDELREVFAEQAALLHGAGADALVVETMAELEECEIAVGCAAATGLPVVGCLSFHGDTQRDFGEIVDRLIAAGADVLGANCGSGVEEHVEVVRRYRAVWEGPLWIKANAGLPRTEGGELVFDMTAEAYAAAAVRLVREGADVIGGCCGTTPEFIAAIGSALARR